MPGAKKTAFLKWLDGELAADRKLARDVDEMLEEMRIEQDLIALREKRGLSQRELAKLLGTSQPYVAKLESGRVKNLGVKTLARWASALGATLHVSIRPTRPVPRTSIRMKARKPTRKA